MEIVSAIAYKILELLVAPIGRQITYVFNYDGNISNLKEKVEKLEMTKARTQHDVDRAEGKGEEIESDVRKWLSEVNDITGEIDKILKDEEQATKKCFMGLCPNLKSRHQLSRKAKKKLEVILNLQGEGKFHTVSYPAAASQGIGLMTLQGYEAFESRTLVLNQILEALKDADVNMIGLYGMGGVGKTTLLRKVAEQVRKDNIFDVLVLAVVSHAPVLKNIQGEIADGLGFKLEAETVKGRANLLRERLKKEKKILVILDDIWARLELEDVGIPYGSDHEGCKLLMTSRSQNVLSRDMGVKDNFMLQVLPGNEAWNFFERMVGNAVQDPSLLSVIPEVAERCAGLPILLATVARALKNGNLSEWKDALERLKNKEEIDAQVYSGLELSYNSLKGDEIKSLFLLCGQLTPHWIPIKDLLIYTMGLGLFKRCNTLEATRHRLYTYVKDLKASCLLLEWNTDGRVEMHDIVHKFAASIASRDHHVFAVANGTALNEWPTEDVLEQCTAISLPWCKIPELPAALKCPETESFILYATDTSLKVQDDFFREMKKLKVIALADMHISAIPSSLQFLENLQSLCLYRCDLRDIAKIGELKRLLVLCLFDSNIVRLPREIGQLTRLQLLDLSNNPTLEEISPNVLSCLTQLEELSMENSFLRWEDEGSKQVRRNASLAELKHLQNLLALDIHITDAKLLPKDLFFDKLERFRIFIGDGWNWLGKYEASKTLKLKLNTSIFLFEAGIRLLLKRTEDLHLHDPKGVKNILYELDAQGFHLLKHLHIEESLEIQYIVDSGPSIAFPRLESLSLDNLNSMEKICNGRPRKDSFSNLRILKIETCHRLKNLFSLSLARDILRLEEIGITNCKIMEVIVAEESEGDAEHKDEVLKWSQLRTLTLERLPQLTNIRSKVNGPSTSHTNDVRSNIEIVSETELETPMPAFNKKIVFLNLEDLKMSTLQVEKIWSDQSIDMSSCFQKLTNLTVERCGKIKYLFTSSMVKSLAHLKGLEICDCKLMEDIINTEGAIASEVVFPKLDFLKLSRLQNLLRFCNSNLIECPFLKELQIENCHALETFISNSVAANTKSTLFDENVAFPNLERLVLNFMDGLEIIWHHELHSDSFCMLKKLEVQQGKKLLNIFPPKLLRRFKNLENLVVTDCASLEEVFDLRSLINEKEAHDVTATQLRILYLWKLPSLKHVWNGNPKGILSFQNLHMVCASKCPGLKSLFPSSISMDLLQLEKLDISECGIEEIVSKEEGVEAVPRFEFPRVTSLILFDLPKLRRFYPELHTSEWPVLKELRVYHCGKMTVFDSEIQNLQGPFRKDEIEILVPQALISLGKIAPNLEEFALNSKDTTMVWEGQFPADFFHKLKVLELQCFHNESAVFPFDLLIQRVYNLEKVVVRHGLFKELFSSGPVGEEKHATLAWIKCLKLDWLPNLERIWNQDLLVDQLIQNLEGLEVWSCDSLTNLAPSTASFQNLRSLDVYDCEGLIYLIASSTARSLVQLTAMTVRECNVVTEIVANEGDESENEIIFRKLESLELYCLASLTSFSSANFTFKFPSLTEVIVNHCPKMETFSQGVLSAPKLQRVWLARENNKGQWKGDLNKTIQQLCTEAVGFQGLQQLKLSEFPRLKEVWHGEVLGEIFCDLKSLVVEDCASFLSAIPSNLLLSLNNLEELDVRNCESLEEVFNLEGLHSDQGHVGLLPKLERFYLIDLLKLRNVWNESLLRILDLRGLKLLKVHHCRSLRNIFTPSIAAILLQLQELEVKWCPMIEEIITRRSEEEAKTDKIIFPQLNSIILESLPNLTSFYCGRGVVECPSLKSVCMVDCLSTFSSAFWRRQAPTENGAAEPKIVFSNLESMELSSIKLEKIWHDHSCVQKLTTLTVEGCGNLRYLFTSSMLESLEQLQELKIYDCKRMEEIIVTEHLGEGENVSEIVFPELSSLELKGLPKLIRFCICNLIKCPSLEVLQIEKCPNLKTFVSNSVSAEVGTTTSEPKRTNSTLFDDKVAFPNLERLVLDYMDGLKVIWHRELHSDSFCKLKAMKVEQGKKLLNIFPPKLLRRFKNLEYLEVNECASLEEVFDVQSLINEKEAHDVTATQLIKLYLWKLPRLKHVWNGNPQGILSFQNLHMVIAWKCPSLKSLFPSSIAMDLPQLEQLIIEECGIEEIVSKEEGVEAVPRFEFPRVTSLILFDLPALKRFYPEMHTSEWPVLKKLTICHCEKMTVFDSESQNLQGTFKEDEIEIQVAQPFFSIGKITPNLEEFSLNSKDTKMIWEGQFPADFFHKLKVLSLHCFHDESEDFPFGLLQRFQNMEKLLVRFGHFKQLFPDVLAFEEEHARALTRIRHLRLSRLPDLEHIWNQHFQVDLLLPNLETLEVLRCNLIYLAPATVSFQNLRVLKVYRCKALIYLVTSSTAKHLVQLTVMIVEECDMVTEVVSIGQEKAENEIIIFKKLKYLTLDTLASLTCFCSANFTFKFPSLAEVTVIQCPKMDIFSRGVLSTPKLERVWLTSVKDRGRWKGNLNSTIQQLYTEVNTQDSEEE